MRPRVLFTTGSDLVSRTIQLFTGSHVSHSAVVLGDHIVHAVGRGVVYEPRQALYDRYHYRDVVELEVLPDVQPGVSRVLGQVGKPYDYPEIVSRPVLLAARFICPWIPAQAVGLPDRRTCARLLLDLDLEGKVLPEWSDIDRSSATPIDLVRRVGPSFRRV